MTLSPNEQPGLLLANLPRGSLSQHGYAVSVCVAPGTPYVSITPPNQTLGSGQTATAVVSFVNPGMRVITYQPIVLAGPQLP